MYVCTYVCMCVYMYVVYVPLVYVCCYRMSALRVLSVNFQLQIFWCLTVTVIADFIEILLRKGPNAYNTFVLYLKEHQPFIATQLEGSSQTPLPCSSS